MREATIINTTTHTKTGVMVTSFGTDGAAHLTVLRGEQPGIPFILDTGSVRELAAILAAIAVEGSDEGGDDA